jgi:hypothetical protein
VRAMRIGPLAFSSPVVEVRIPPVVVMTKPLVMKPLVYRPRVMRPRVLLQFSTQDRVI